MQRDRSIGSRLYWACFWVYLAVAAVIGLAQIGEIFLRERAEVERDLAGYAQSFDKPLAAALWSLDDAEVASLVQGLLLLPPIVGVRVHDPSSGAVFAQAGTIPGAAMPDGESANGVAATTRRLVPALEHLEGIAHQRAIWFFHQTGTTEVGVLTLYSDLGQVFDRIWLSLVLVLIGAVIKAATLWIIFRSMFRLFLSRPLHRLANSMERLDIEHPQEVDADGSLRAIGREVNSLVLRFNGLVARLRREMTAHRELRDALERQVQERTAELSLARERAEEARRTAESADQAKSRFLALMSHELRTPMTGVLGMMEIMQTEPLTPAQQENLRIMRGSAETLMTILNDILDLSRIEAGYLELQKRPFDLRDLLFGVIKLFQNNARAKGLTLGGRIDPRVPARLSGDVHRLRQILGNLVSNGVKFTEQGQVTVSVHSRGVRDRRAALSLVVADTGPGVAVEQRAALFKPFSQLDQVTSRRFGGTGLGLVVCERLVAAMGGTIRYEDAELGGAAFHVELVLEVADADRPPCAPARGHPGAPGLGADPAPGPLRILLVEDVDANRAIVRALLGREGHTVEAVASGSEAVNAVATGRFDLVLMDIHMPGMDGIAATRAIRRLPAPANGVPILALTADVLGARMGASDVADFDGVVAKPLEWDRLRATIAATLRAGSASASAPGAVAPERPGARPETDGARIEAARTEAAAAVLDAAALEQVRSGLTEAEAAALYRDFLDTIREQVTAIRRSHADQDRAALRAAAHALKGTAANFAALRLSAEAAALQTHLDAGQAPERGAIEALERSLFLTMAAVRAEFSL